MFIITSAGREADLLVASARCISSFCSLPWTGRTAFADLGDLYRPPGTRSGNCICCEARKLIAAAAFHLPPSDELHKTQAMLYEPLASARLQVSEERGVNMLKRYKEREPGKAFSHVVKNILVDFYRPEVRYVAK